MKSYLLHKLIRNRILQHLSFWSISWYILLRIFAGPEEIKTIDLIYTTFFLLPVTGCVYANILIFIPQFLEKKRYLPYLFLQAISVTAFAGLNIFLFSHFIDLVFPGYYFISDYDFTDLYKFFISFILITTLLKLSKGWFQWMETRSYLERLEKEHAKAELETLKGQVNPHFLFNSLNTLYSLVLKKSDTAPEYVLKLSGLLRYLLYETSAPLVNLEKELTRISDYIELQKLRAGKQATVKYQITGDVAGKQIAPLLFLPLIENSFKHGIKGETGESFVDIDLVIQENELVFNIRNNRGYADPVEKNHRTGIGLENLKKRLELVYPDHYSMIKTMDHDVFHVKLIVPLQNENQMSDRGG